MFSSPTTLSTGLAPGNLRHHIALNVHDLQASPLLRSYPRYARTDGRRSAHNTAIALTAGKVANFVTPDGTILDLFWEPELLPPDVDPNRTLPVPITLPLTSIRSCLTEQSRY
jgi:glyoxylase I family protein